MSFEEKKRKLGELLNIEEKIDRKRTIEEKMSDVSFWVSGRGEDGKTTKELTKELAEINKLINEFEAANNEEKLKKLEVLTLFSGEYDGSNAIVELSAGTGGVEAQDWAEMLLRMILRYAERKGLAATVLGKNPGTEAGIKGATVLIKGKNAYGMMKSEKGVLPLRSRSQESACNRPR